MISGPYRTVLNYTTTILDIDNKRHDIEKGASNEQPQAFCEESKKILLETMALIGTYLKHETPVVRELALNGMGLGDQCLKKIDTLSSRITL